MNIVNKISKSPYLWLGVLLAITSVLYIPSIIQIVKFWSHSPAYSHSILLVPICIYLVYKHIIYRNLQQQITPIYIVLLVLSIVLWLLSMVGNIQVTEFIALFAIYISILFFYFGARQVSSMAILLLMLIFTLPVWEYLSVAIRIITTPIVELMLQLSNINFRVDGFFVILKAGIFVIEESCSGLHQITAAVPLLIIYAHKRIKKKLHWLALAFGAVLTAFIANTIRIYIVIMIGEMTNMQHSLVKEHGLIGWIIFGILFALYIVWLEKIVMRKIAVREINPVNNPASSKSPVVYSKLYLLVTMVLVTGPIIYGLYNYKQFPVATNETRLEAVMPWKSKSTMPTFKPDYPNGDFTLNKVYENVTGNNVNLFLSLYVNEQQGIEAVNNLNKVYTQDKWQLVKDNNVSIKLPDTDYVANEIVIGSQQNEYYIIWYGYVVDSQYLINPARVKLAGLYQKIKFQPGVLFFTVSKKIETNYELSRKQLAQFVTENLPPINRQIFPAQR